MSRTPEHQAVVDYVTANSHSPKQLIQRASELLHQAGQSDLYQDRTGGVVGHLVKIDNPDWSDLQVLGALRGLGVPEGFVPVSAILRDALPLFIQLKRLLLPITGGYTVQREELVTRLGGVAREFQSPSDANVLDLAQLTKLGESWVKDLPK